MRITPRRDLLALLGASTLAVSCGSALGGARRRTHTLRYQGWAGTVTPAELAEDLGYLGRVRLEWVGNTISGPADVQAAASGQIDFGGAFNGAVVKLASGKAPIKAVISYYGSNRLSYNGLFVPADSPVRSARDLLGRKVGMNTLGGHAEALVDLYCRGQGLTPEEAERVERIVVPPVNTEQTLRQGRIDVAALSGILQDRAVENGGIRRVLADHELLGSFSAGTYVMTERFLESNPDTARAFVTGVARALEWSRTTPRRKVIERMVRIVRRRDRNEDPAPLRYWKSYGVDAPGGRIAERELALWADWLADRGDIPRGRLTLSEVYTNAFNDLGASPPARSPSTSSTAPAPPAASAESSAPSPATATTGRPA